ncbi:hypothetical protein ABZ904_31035 [Streptomyces sp. NPDC046900]|uniref:hypothetical protein n=1 Tax=Streptomyces sp. NPDC046900 TaxID=3155473 RepID=UPI0033D9DE11
MIEGLTPDATDDPLAVGIHPRHPRRALEDFHLFGCEYRVEGLAVLVIAVVHQEPQWLHARAEVGGEISCLLDGPGLGRVGSDAGDMEPAGAVLGNASAYSLLPSAVSMRGKSQAMVPSAWVVRNSRLVGPERRGVGSTPAAWRISQTVEAAMGWPSRAGSPWILLCPHVGFSRARRRMSFLIASLVGGRPVRERRLL